MMVDLYKDLHLALLDLLCLLTDNNIFVGL